MNANGSGPASAASSPVTPLAVGTVPTASAPVRTADGFTFTITNYDPATTYQVIATNGATVNRAGALVTVSGLDPAAGSTVTLSAAVAGFTTTSVDVSGSALAAGVAPTFTAATRTPDGYSFQISNYVPSAIYTFDATAGTLTVIGSQVVVSGLEAGQTSDVTVHVARTGYTDASATESAAALAVGTAPVFDNVTQSADGFTFVIANYSAGLVYTFASTGGADVTRIGPNVIVSGLAPGDGSTVTVTATDPGASTAAADVSSAALLAGLTPDLSAPVRTADGFTFTITNYDPAFTFAADATGGADVSVDGTGLVTVSGLAAGDASTVTITASRSGYASASATATSSALGAGIVPSLSAPTSTADGFTFDIENYDPAAGYVLTASNDAVVYQVAGHVVVTGLDAAASATITVTVSAVGALDAQASVTGQALSLAPAPSPTPTPTPKPTPSTVPTTGPSSDPSGEPTQAPSGSDSPVPAGVDAFGIPGADGTQLTGGLSGDVPSLRLGRSAGDCHRRGNPRRRHDR